MCVCVCDVGDDVLCKINGAMRSLIYFFMFFNAVYFKERTSMENILAVNFLNDGI